MAFLGREYKVLAVFVAVVAVLLAVGYSGVEGQSALIAVSFVVGAGCSGLAGYFGMRVATLANVRTTEAAKKGLSPALDVAFGCLLFKPPERPRCTLGHHSRLVQDRHEQGCGHEHRSQRPRPHDGAVPL